MVKDDISYGSDARYRRFCLILLTNQHTSFEKHLNIHAVLFVLQMTLDELKKIKITTSQMCKRINHIQIIKHINHTITDEIKIYLTCR